MVINYIVTKNAGTKKATVTFDVKTISGAFNSTLGASFGVNIINGSDNMFIYMMCNGSNYVVNGVNGSIHVVKDIQMTDTTASIPLEVMITGKTTTVNVNITWKDSDLK